MTHPRLAILASCAALAAVAATARAQAPIEVGSRIRVTVLTERPSVSVGTFVGVEHDSLAYLLPGTTLARRVPLSIISSIDVSTALHRHTLRGALIGGGIGAGTGAVLFSAVGGKSSWAWPSSRGDRAIAGGLAGGALGALIGGIAGYEAVRDTWLGVTPETLRGRVAFSTTGSWRHPTGVRLRVSF